MNILIIHPKIIWRGAEQTLINVATGLCKRGHKVKLVSLYIDSDNGPINYKELNYILPNIFWQKMFKDHFVIFLLLGFWFLLFLAYKNSKGVDIINSHNFPSSWVAVIVGKIRKIPVVWMVHDIPKKISLNKENSIGEYLVWWLGSGLIDKYFIRKINLILVGSSLMKDQISARYSKPSILLYHPVSEIFFEKQRLKNRVLEKLKNKFVITSAANLHSVKNQTVIIEAMPAVLEKVPSAYLVIAGDGPLKKKYENLIEESNLQDHVLLVGVKPHLELSYIYSCTRVLIVASLSEPWGMTPFEAILKGAFPVVSEYAGCGRVIKENKFGITIKPNSKEITKAVMFVKNNPGKVDKMVAEGQRWVRKNMILSKFCEQMEKLMFKAISDYKYD